MINRAFVKLLLLVLACMAPLSATSAQEPFYWKNSYGRGAGTALSANCGGNQLSIHQFIRLPKAAGAGGMLGQV